MPEDSVNYEGGFRLRNKFFRAEVIGFWNYYKNLTEVCTLSSGCVNDGLDRQFNRGKVRIQGFEVFVESEARPNGKLRLPVRVSYTFTTTRFLSSFVSDEPQLGTVREGDELPYVPKNQLSFALGAEHKIVGLNVAGTFVSSMRERSGQGPAEVLELTDAYFTLDASAYYRFARAFTFYVNGRNLLGSEYLVARRPFGARPGAPRWLQAGLKAEF